MKAVIITKSAMNKNNIKGTCTTAFDVNTGRIVRFVSDPQGAPIPYSVSNSFNKLDLVQVNELRLCPIGPQTENILVDLKSFSVRGHGYSMREIYQVYETNRPSVSFLNVGSNKLDSVNEYQHSLEIAYVTDFSLEKNQYETIKASFRIGNSLYRYFSITDFDYDLRNSGEVSKSYGNGWIVASIPTEPYIREGVNQGYFIFIAAFYPDIG